MSKLDSEEIISKEINKFDSEEINKFDSKEINKFDSEEMTNQKPLFPGFLV